MKARRFSKAAAAAVAVATILGAVLLPAARAETLKETVQARLDAHPALVRQALKMRVMQEMRGSVVLELNEGPKILRDLLRKGIELNGAGMRDAALKQEDLAALRSIRMAVQAVKAIKGVNDISLTGSINPLDPAESEYNLACRQIAQGTPSERDEALQLLKHAAEAGFPPAQCDLASYYLVGGGVDPDELNALFWYRKAAEQDEPRAQFNLGKMLANGQGGKRDYAEAIQWYRKAAAQDRQWLAKTKSLPSLAMLLATCPQARLRDGQAAEKCLDEAERLDPDNPGHLEVRAAVRALCGRFSEAVEQQQKWIAYLQSASGMTLSERDARIERAQNRLELYEKGRIDIGTGEPEAEANP